jgi:hypothetical protein
MIRYYSFSSQERLREAVRKVGESEIAFILMGFNPAMMASNIATNNDEDLAYLTQYTEMVQGPGFMIIIAGNSSNDFAFKKQVLEKILSETGGESLKPVEDPANAGGFLWRFIRVTGSIRETCRPTGVFGGEVGGTDVFNLMSKFIEQGSKVKEDCINNDLLYADGTDPFVQLIEHGHCGHGELLIRYVPSNPAAVQASFEVFMAANRTAVEKHFGVPHHVWSDDICDMYGPTTSNYTKWLRCIKKTFDPNGSSEASHYITPKD